MKQRILFGLFGLLGTLALQAQLVPVATYQESYRPQYHFTPPQNWINDPNGLVYLNGEYHLFYQYNPFENTWGHMSWGHAVSKDLLRWDHLPVALQEFDNPDGKSKTMIFSGSAVVDKANTSGLCPPGTSDCLVAVYTSHVHEDGKGTAQHQSLAYSTDGGRTFEQYTGNPVLQLNSRQFRDPSVFWYAPGKKWVMAVVKPNQHLTMFYESKDLKSWSLMSSFGKVGDTSRIWECPALVEVPIEGEPGKTKWVLFISAGHPQEGAIGMQYYVGHFDGRQFILDKASPAAKPPLYSSYVDWGKDYYAAIPFNNLPATHKKPVMLGWMNNWEYARKLPTKPFNGLMSVPREIGLRRIGTELHLVQQPIAGVATLRGAAITQPKFTVANGTPRNVPVASATAYELACTFTPGTARLVSIDLTQSAGRYIRLTFDATDKTQAYVRLDRTQSGQTSFAESFASVESAPVRLVDGQLTLRVLVDASSIEVFINEGERVISNLFFPDGPTTGLKVTATGGNAAIQNLTVWSLQPTMLAQKP